MLLSVCKAMLGRIEQGSRVWGDQRFEHSTGNGMKLFDYCSDLGHVVEGGGFSGLLVPKGIVGGDVVYRWVSSTPGQCPSA